MAIAQLLDRAASLGGSDLPGPDAVYTAWRKIIAPGVDPETARAVERRLSGLAFVVFTGALVATVAVGVASARR